MRLFVISIVGAAMCLISNVQAAPPAINTDVYMDDQDSLVAKRGNALLPVADAVGDHGSGIDKGLLRDVVDALSAVLEPTLELDDTELDDLVENVLEKLELEDIGDGELLTSPLDIVAFALDNLLDVVSEALDELISR